MRRRFTIKNRLFLIFTFFMMATFSFLAFKNMQDSSAVNAAYNGFKAGNIISDSVMSDYSSMSESSIQSFLKSKNPCNDTDISKAARYSSHNYHIVNGHFVCMADESFNGESAAHIIWQAAYDYRINPKVIIVLLEKEQGLVTDTWPNSDLQYRSATGYGCPDTAACDSQYYGFKNQVRNAAELFRYILDNGSRYYPVGNNYVKYNPDGNCGGSTVYIENRATSALYQYTPYQPNNAVLNANPGTVVSCGAYGNSNFYYYYTKWFGDTHGKELVGIYLPEDIYQLRTVDNLSLSFEGNNNGSSAVVANANSDDDLQKFRAIKDGKYYRFQNIKTKKYLDVYNNETYDGTKVELWDGNNGCSQKWLIRALNSGYRLISACSSELSTKSLDIHGGGTNSPGAKIDLWSSNNSVAQQWNFVNYSSAPVSNGTYGFQSTGGKIFTPEQEYYSAGAKMVIWEKSSSISSKFNITRLENGYYRLENSKTGLYLATNGLTDGANVFLDKLDANNCNQRWAIEKSGNYYKLRSSCSGKTIDINQANVATNGARVQLWTDNSSNAQKWTITATPVLAQPIPDGVYAINSALGDNLRLDVNGSRAYTNGTNVHLWRRNGADNQKYQFTYEASTGYYTIKSVGANRYLDTASGGANGANLQVYSAGSGCAQRWILIPTGGQYYIVSTCQRNAIDVFGAGTSNGSNVGVWILNGGRNQRWSITDTNQDAKGAIDNGTYIITSKMNQNLAMDIFGNSAANGINVGVWSLHKGANQQFKITFDTGTGFYTIYNAATKRNLDATGAIARNGTNLEIWSGNSSCAQQWGITKADGNYYRIASACNTDFSLDIEGARNSAGANIQLWGNHNNANQQWLFTKI